MRELTFEEMDQVAGGGVFGDIGLQILIKSLEYAWDHKEEYFEYWLKCIGQYPAGPYDYRVAGS